MRILALTKYGSLAASTRQRFMQYEPALAEAGIGVDYAPLLKNHHLERLVKGRRTSWLSVAGAYAGRVLTILGSGHYDALWVHSELFPYLPGFAERLARLWRKPIVFDCDDAIFHMYDSSSSPVVRRFLGEKLKPLLRSASVCCCGNAYLQQYAARFCSQSIVLPTVVDTEAYRPRHTGPNDPLVIGWIGSPSTWCNVQRILPVLADVARERRVKVRAIGAGHEATGVSFPGVEFVDWHEETEVEEVRQMDIGIMPLLDLPFQRGKSGYKLIQYMACALPVVASPVGVNCDIVSHGRSGYLATNEIEWAAALSSLVADADLRAGMGAEGRRRAVSEYSLASHGPRLVDVMRSVICP